MTDNRTHTLAAFLDGTFIDAAVGELRPDYRTLLIAVDGIAPAQNSPSIDAMSDPVSDRAIEELLSRAEAAAQELLAEVAVEDVAHVAAWREAYRAFGAKPQRTRNSLEALMRRASTAGAGAGAGLPRVNRLTDVYNAISVLYQVPIGGEDLSAYYGPPSLVRATGSEVFDTVVDGQPSVEHPYPGEVVWRDNTGVTCRRWNWRQGRRTQLTGQTTGALFILDALAPMSDDELVAAGDALTIQLRQLGPDVRVASRMLAVNDSEEHS